MQADNKNPSAVERRSSPRVTLNYQFQIDLGGQSYWVIAHDLGLGGAFIETDAPLRDSVAFSFSFNSLSGSESTCARLIWENNAGFGIAFVDPPKLFQDKLQALLGPLLSDNAGSRRGGLS